MNRKLILIGFGLIASLIYACSQDDYLIDTGKHDPVHEGSILHYLQSRPDLFTDLVKVVQIAGMEEVFEKDTITFFAPPDESIHRAVNLMNDRLFTLGKDTVSDYRQVAPEVWEELLSYYIFDGKYLLKDYPQLDTLSIPSFPGQGYVSRANRIMNIGVIFRNANGVEYAGYRQIVISYIPDQLEPLENWVNAPIASSNIQPYNGVVHALNYVRHHFGFDLGLFADKAIGAGIKPLDALGE